MARSGPKSPLTTPEILAAWRAEGTCAKAAEKLGVSEAMVQKRLWRARMRGEELTPQHHDPTSPYVTKGVSTLFGRDGRPRLRWEKTSLKEERLNEAREAALRAMCDAVPPAAPVPLALSARHVERTLCNVYTITDAHIGMYAAAAETGGDWDLGIAERVIAQSLTAMVAAAPPAELAVVVQLGDFLHFDGLAAVTPTSRHLLDPAGRFSELVGVAVRSLKGMVAAALARHPRVALVVAEGNHDLASSTWLCEMARERWRNEPRVEVIGGPRPYYALEHGSVLLGWHHGHLTKPQNLPLLFADMFAAEWGRTAHRYIHTGHRHHHARDASQPGAEVVQHPALASMDAYAARHGYRSSPRSSAITYHADFGEVASNTVSPEMFRGKGVPPNGPDDRPSGGAAVARAPARTVSLSTPAVFTAKRRAA